MCPHEEKNKLPKRLSPSAFSLWKSLVFKKRFFEGKGDLAKDGSFYCTDSWLSREHGVTGKTIMRSVRRLESAGKIKCQRGKFRGWATKYWILEMPDYLSSFHTAAKPDILSRKVDNLSFKGRQNVTPSNLSNKLRKDYSFEKEEMTDDQRKEMHIGFRECINALKRKSSAEECRQ